MTSWDALGTYLKHIKKAKRDLKSGQERCCFADAARHSKTPICFFTAFHAFRAFQISKKQALKKYGLLFEKLSHFSLTFHLLFAYFFLTYFNKYSTFFFLMISHLATLGLP